MEGLCCLMGSRSKYHKADRHTEEDRMCIGIKQACERTIKTQGSNYQSCPTMTRHDFKNTKTCSRGAMYHQSCLRRTLSRRRNFATSISLLFYTHSILNLIILPAILLFLNTTGGSFSTVRVVNACHPGGRYGGGRHIPRKIVPMVCGQHIPNVSEKTIGASGPAEGKITRDSKRYREELKSNWNPNIFFRDEEGTMADHMMTERCRDFLNRLAIMVAERWKNKVILRVVEAWDEDGAHEPNSLHYEGRAVDITTNDTDRSKYGILARLAVEAGFDWVYYQSRSHVHCSVKSDKSDAARYGGCFSGDSLAYRPDGSTVLMSQLLPGDSVLSVDSAGNIVDDEVLSFMDRIPSRNIQTAMKFIRITTDKGNSLTLTSNHLVYAIVTNDIHIPYLHIDTGQDMRNLADFVYAHLVKVGDYVFETQNALNTTEKRNKITKPSRVIAVTSVSSSEGAYAPLTGQGTILVNGVTASCYAVFDSHNIAHLAMGPMRLYNRVVNLWVTPKMEINNDVPWYPRFLYELGSAFFSEHMLPS